MPRLARILFDALCLTVIAVAGCFAVAGVVQNVAEAFLKTLGWR